MLREVAMLVAIDPVTLVVGWFGNLSTTGFVSGTVENAIFGEKFGWIIVLNAAGFWWRFWVAGGGLDQFGFGVPDDDILASVIGW